MHRQRRVLRGSVRIPTSKPVTQRALLMGALADGVTTVQRPNVCSESVVLQRACAALGARFHQGDDMITVDGTAGAPSAPSTILRAAGSGFALRHLVALCCLADGPCVLTGDERLAARPLSPLVDALTGLGGKLEAADPARALPLVSWSRSLAGGVVRVPADDTSQFVSALLLVAPYATGPVTVRVPRPVVGAPYIRMTLAMMREFGARAEADDDLTCVEVRPGGYRACATAAGADATSLFYFVAAAVVADADITVCDVALGRQPFLDSVVGLGRRLGVRIDQQGADLRIRTGEPPARRVEVDACDVPTLVPALAAVAAGLPAGMRLTGARHLRHHKTSRLAVVMDQLALLGRPLAPLMDAGVLDGFTTLPLRAPTAATLDGHGDHRNVMALYLAALGHPRPVTITGGETLGTSFASFATCFRHLAAHDPYPAALPAVVGPPGARCR